MDKKRLEPRELKVRTVWDFIQGYDENHIHTLQQVLMAFGQAPKLERILWALLKREYLRRKTAAEEHTAQFLIQQEKDPDNAHLVEQPEGCKDGEQTKEETPEEKAARIEKVKADYLAGKNMYKKSLEEGPPPFTVGLCPKCGSIKKGG
jgi:hypothetical protein